MSTPESVARADALDRLARPPRRPLFRRRGPRDAPDPARVLLRPVLDQGQSDDHDGRVARSGPPDRGGHIVRRRGQGPASAELHGPLLPPDLPRWAVAVALVVLVATGGGAWVVLRRAPAPEDALPRAGPASSAPSSTVLEPDAAAGPAATGDGGTSSPAPGTTPRSGPVTVHVAGAVARPGVVSLPAGSRAVDAVAAAGGMAAGADPDRVNLAAKVVDGERLVVPLVGQAPPVEVSPVPGGGTGASGVVAAAGPVDLNAATAEQLDALPGVGPATAAAIVSYRERHGPFRTVDGLLEVRGIGDAKLEALRDLVTVGP